MNARVGTDADGTITPPAPTPRTPDLFRRALERIDVDTTEITDTALERVYRAALYHCAQSRVVVREFPDALLMVVDVHGGAR